MGIEANPNPVEAISKPVCKFVLWLGGGGDPDKCKAQALPDSQYCYDHDRAIRRTIQRSRGAEVTLPHACTEDGCINPQLDGKKFCAHHQAIFDTPETSIATPEPDFEPLKKVFEMALDQAMGGKGKERHNKAGEAFVDQFILKFGKWVGSNHGQIFQACKKAVESTGLPKDRAIRELLGSMVYIGAAVIHLLEDKNG